MNNPQINLSTLDKLRKITKKGYIQVLVNDKWIYEHKYIVELKIGRELTNEEVVHHINGIKSDNRIENLMLFKDQKEHQSFHNKIKQFGYTNPVKRQIENRWD